MSESRKGLILAQNLVQFKDLHAMRMSLENQCASEYNGLRDRIAEIEEELRRGLTKAEERTKAEVAKQQDANKNMESLFDLLASTVKAQEKRLESERKEWFAQTARESDRGKDFGTQLSKHVERMDKLSALHAEHDARMTVIEKGVKQVEFGHAGFAKAVAQDLSKLREKIHSSADDCRTFTSARLEESLGSVSSTCNTLRCEMLSTSDALRNEMSEKGSALALSLGKFDKLQKKIDDLSIKLEHLSVKKADTARIEELMVKKADMAHIQDMIGEMEVQIWPWRSVQKWAKQQAETQQPLQGDAKMAAPVTLPPPNLQPQSRLASTSLRPASASPASLRKHALYHQ